MIGKNKHVCAAILLLCIIANPSAAGTADVVNVEVAATGKNFDFAVAVKHADEGWDHYADRWQVVGEDGTVYGTRTLHHPHVEEQPFTRHLQGVEIPDGISAVVLRAGDSVHGFGGAEIRVELPGR